MLWRPTAYKLQGPHGAKSLPRKNDLQYNMHAARRNFENEARTPMPKKYPGSFVGWLVVE